VFWKWCISGVHVTCITGTAEVTDLLLQWLTLLICWSDEVILRCCRYYVDLMMEYIVVGYGICALLHGCIAVRYSCLWYRYILFLWFWFYVTFYVQVLPWICCPFCTCTTVHVAGYHSVVGCDWWFCYLEYWYRTVVLVCRWFVPDTFICCSFSHSHSVCYVVHIFDDFSLLVTVIFVLYYAYAFSPGTTLYDLHSIYLCNIFFCCWSCLGDKTTLEQACVSIPLRTGYYPATFWEISLPFHSTSVLFCLPGTRFRSFPIQLTWWCGGDFTVLLVGFLWSLSVVLFFWFFILVGSDSALLRWPWPGLCCWCLDFCVLFFFYSCTFPVYTPAVCLLLFATYQCLV
jgi:hypothetical protein